MILEGIVTTIGDDGIANISPMGPLVDRQLTKLVFRPYQTSSTFQNLKRVGRGVFHVTDDVLLIARAAINQLEPIPKLIHVDGVQGSILADACRWYEFKVVSLDCAQERSRIESRICQKGRIRDFFGFNRAKHAVVEAAILATRIDFLPLLQIHEQFERLAVLVEKTAGDQEREAFELLQAHVFGVR